MTMTSTERPAIRVRCDDCQLPVLKIVRGGLVIEGRHHGRRHVTVVPLAALLDMLEASTVR